MRILSLRCVIRINGSRREREKVKSRNLELAVELCKREEIGIEKAYFGRHSTSRRCADQSIILYSYHFSHFVSVSISAVAYRWHWHNQPNLIQISNSNCIHKIS